MCNGVVLVLVLVERVCVGVRVVFASVFVGVCSAVSVFMVSVCRCRVCSVVWHTTTDRQTHRHTLHEPKPHCTWFLFTSIRV